MPAFRLRMQGIGAGAAFGLVEQPLERAAWGSWIGSGLRWQGLVRCDLDDQAVEGSDDVVEVAGWFGPLEWDRAVPRAGGPSGRGSL